MSNEMAGAAVVVVLTGLICLVCLLVSALLLALSAKIFSLPNRSFLKALGCTALLAVIYFMLSLAFSLMFGGIGSIVAFVAIFFVGGAVISGLYRSSYGAGLGATLLWTVFSAMLSCIILVPLSLIGVMGVSVLGNNINQQFQGTADQIRGAAELQDSVR